MPEPTQQSPTTVPQGNDVVPGEGNRNAEDQGKVSTPESSSSQQSSGAAGEVPAELKLINELTGRSYTSLDDAKKGVKETYGFVGTLGQKASVVEKLAEKIAKENGVEVEVAMQHLQELVQEAKNPPKEESTGNQTPDARPNNLQEANAKFLTEKVQELSFLQDKPEAKPFIDVIRDIHRGTGKDFTTIFNDQISPLINAGKKAAYETQEVKSGQGVALTGGTPPQTDTYGQTFEAWTKNPKQTSLMDVLKAKGMSIVPEE